MRKNIFQWNVIGNLRKTDLRCIEEFLKILLNILGKTHWNLFLLTHHRSHLTHSKPHSEHNVITLFNLKVTA